MGSKTILVVGAESGLGQSLLARTIGEGHRVLATSRKSRKGCFAVDFSDPPRKWQIPEEVDVAFLCAGMTSVTACREDPDRAWAINVHGTAALAQRLIDRGAFVVFPSSNRVFDGNSPWPKADSATMPMTEYGRTKAAAEEKLLRLGQSVAVIRLTKILGADSSPIRNWNDCLRRRLPVQPYADMVMAPVSLRFVTDLLLRIAAGHFSGVSQASGAADVTFEQVCRAVCRHLAAEESLVRPITCHDGSVQDHVPTYTALDTSRIQAAFGLAPPSIDDTLRDVL
jgi:dTDP-4-dehydrorhamnose reductase